MRGGMEAGERLSAEFWQSDEWRDNRAWRTNFVAREREQTQRFKMPPEMIEEDIQEWTKRWAGEDQYNKCGKRGGKTRKNGEGDGLRRIESQKSDVSSLLNYYRRTERRDCCESSNIEWMGSGK